MIRSRAALLINTSDLVLVERETGTLPVRAIWATKIRTASGNEVPSSWVTFAARLRSFGSTRHRKSTVMLQMCHARMTTQAFFCAGARRVKAGEVELALKPGQAVVITAQ